MAATRSTVGLSTPRPSVLIRVILGVAALIYVLLVHTSLTENLALVTRLIANPQPHCSYIQTPGITILSADSVSIDWRTSCRLGNAVVEYGRSDLDTSGETANDETYKRQQAPLVKEGPLSSWFQYTAILPVASGQYLRYGVVTSNAVLDMYPPAYYRHVMSHTPSNITTAPAAVRFGIGITDVSTVNERYTSGWASGVLKMFREKNLSFVVDSGSTRARFTGHTLEGIPSAPPSEGLSFAGWIGDICVLSANIASDPEWSAAAMRCNGAQQSVVVANMGWMQSMLYRLGTFGVWETSFYTGLVETMVRISARAVIIKASRTLRSVDLLTRSEQQEPPARTKCRCTFSNMAAAAIESDEDGKLHLSVYGARKDRFSVIDTYNQDGTRIELIKTCVL